MRREGYSRRREGKHNTIARYTFMYGTVRERDEERTTEDVRRIVAES